MRSHTAKKWGTIIVIIFAVTLLVLGILFSFQGDTRSVQNRGSIPYFSEQSMPSSFSVSESYETDVFDKGNSWGASVASLLEGSYRYFGVQTNFLPQKQYVRFSSNSPVSAANRFCQNSNLCKNQGNSFNAALFPIIVINNSSLIPEFSLPIDFCNDSICSNSFSSSKNNPISFEVTNSKWARTIADIKHLIYQEEKPLLMTILEPFISFTLPCSDKKVSSNKECIEKTSETSEYIVSARLPSAEYFLPRKPGKLVLGEPETFLVYGFNDEHVTFIGSNNIESVKSSTGGFIVKKAEGATGNYNKYLQGKTTRFVNNRDCRYNTPLIWKGADIDCVDKHKSLVKCGATLLNCTNGKYCNKKYLYAIASYNGEPLLIEDESGFPYYYFYQVESKKGEDPVLIKFDNVSAFEVSDTFMNKELELNKKCGYWFIPYELIEEEIELSNHESEPVHAVSVAFAWKKESYAKSKEWNYERISRSTYTYW